MINNLIMQIAATPELMNVICDDVLEVMSQTAKSWLAETYPMPSQFIHSASVCLLYLIFPGGAMSMMD